MPKGIFSQCLPELKLKAPCCHGHLCSSGSSPLRTLCTGDCIFLGKEKKLLSFSEFHLFMLLHMVTSMAKISTLENCFSLTAGDNLIFTLTSVLGFPDSHFAA